MKKLLVVFSLVVATAFSVKAQTTTAATEPILSKRGYYILPEAGNFGISFDAAPLLGYFGHIIGGSAGSPSNGFPKFLGGATNAITGRYFLDANTAIRARFRIGFVDTTTKTYNAQNTIDKSTTTSTNIILSAGIEKRRGIHRVQGIYGAEFMIMYTGAGSVKNTPATGSATKTTTAGTFLIGPRAFVGAEYFFAPKISLGGEFGWGILFGATGKDTQNNGSTTTNTTGGGGLVRIDTDNLSGAINLNFYF